jgi:hypothetical protein
MNIDSTRFQCVVCKKYVLLGTAHVVNQADLAMRYQLKLFLGKKIDLGDMCCSTHFPVLDEQFVRSVLSNYEELGDVEADRNLMTPTKKPKQPEMSDDIRRFRTHASREPQDSAHLALTRGSYWTILSQFSFTFYLLLFGIIIRDFAIV